MHRQLLLLLLPLLPLLRAQDPERAVPAFDHGEIAASYAIAVPKGHDGKTPLPLILDFHGAIAPTRKGGTLMHGRLWSHFCQQVPAIVVGLNGRTRSWGTISGEIDDVTFATHVLAEVRRQYPVDPERIYLAGFSSGADFLCQSRMQPAGSYAGSLVTCPGPPNVVGLENGALRKSSSHPFYFVTGEADHIRKDGAWQAFLALDTAGGRTMYREVPRVAHEAFPLDEWLRVFAYLEILAGKRLSPGDLALGRDALLRDDLLCASTHLLREGSEAARGLLLLIEIRGAKLLAEAEAIDAAAEPARAYEAFWRVRTQLHRFPKLAGQAAAGLTRVSGLAGRELGRARARFFRDRKEAAVSPADRDRAPQPEPIPVPAPAPAPDATVAPGAPAAVPSSPPAAVPSSPPAAVPGATDPFAFDRYLTWTEIEAALHQLATRFPQRTRLHSLGRSVQGRDLWLLELGEPNAGGDPKPAAFVQATLHGNEASCAMAALYFAHQCAANPGRKRSVDRLMERTTLYLLPVANPDGLFHYHAAPHSHWRPRFNFSAFDSDGDGRTDEDGSEDLDGDGEIGLMYAPDPEGPYAVIDGKMVRRPGEVRYRLVGREGRDDDGDGKFGEDPPGGVDLNRNFPVGHSPRKTFEGATGLTALSEPETAAIAGFVRAHPEIGLFFDYHNDARCVFHWLGPDAPEADRALYAEATARAEQALEYKPAPLVHGGAGLAIAWAYGELGLPSFLVELESQRGDEETYLRSTWGDDAFLPLRPFDHPQLGAVLIGGEVRKIPKRNLHPTDLPWQCARNWEWLRGELGRLPRLEVKDLRVRPVAEGMAVSGQVVNAGGMATDSAMAARLGRSVPVRLFADGARLVGEAELGALAPGESAAFAVRLDGPAETATLRVVHPRAGTVRVAVVRPRSPTVPPRTGYAVEQGWLTPEHAKLADNGFYRNGQTDAERGPAFPLAHRKDGLRLAVLLGEWHDQRHVEAPEAFERALFTRGTYTGTSPTGQKVYGSLADFYREMSYGRVEVTGRVFGWFELPGNHADYRDASFGSSIVQDRLLAAVTAAHGRDALADFDGIAFVWAGNAVARTSALWPMRLSLKQLPGVVAFKTGELHQGEFLPIGVPCHELGHTFGVNDKYGLGSAPEPLGPYCLMCRGTHGNPPSGRHRPFHFCAWCRMVLGWVTPAVIDPAVPQRLALRPIQHAGTECYRVLLAPDGSEYLLLENRRPEGFHTDLPGPGLLVLHVGPNDKPTAPQTRVRLLAAHGLRAPARGTLARPEAAAWPQGGKTEFTVGSARISGIRLVDDVVYFEVRPAAK